MATPTSEGAQRLGRLGLTHDEVAQALGVSRSVVTHWLRGAKVPGADTRKRIAATFGIQAKAWTRPPVDIQIPPMTSARPARREAGPLENPAAPIRREPRPKGGGPKAEPSPPLPRRRGGGAAQAALASLPKDAIGIAEVLQGMALDLIEHLRTDTRSNPSERARIMQSVAPTLAVLNKITGGFEMTPARILRSAAWKEIEAAFAAGLAGHPEAARSVAAALRALDDAPATATKH